MRRFFCDNCDSEIGFGADRCHACEVPLGYLPSEGDIRAVRSVEGTYTVVGDPVEWWRCLNHAWGCNWMVPMGSGTVWCASCRLTRHRPDTASTSAVLAWASAEGTKRRLVHQLLSLGLPLEPTGSDESRLVFDLVDVPDGGGVTGHREGVVTFDLREVDDAYREAVRRQLGEPFRTVIGHLRHEVGHHFWHTLVHGTEALDEFRRVFGDERSDYPTALADHYAAPPAAASQGYVTSYAMAHPVEDWAETFAHYLHLRDGLETARAHGIGPDVQPDDVDAAALLRAWAWIVDVLTKLEAGLGHTPAYPITLAADDSRAVAGEAALGEDRPGTGLAPVVAKFAFVHRRLLGLDASTGPPSDRPEW
jgi:hypothetical protein